MKIKEIMAMLALLLMVNGALACYGSECRTSAFGSANAYAEGTKAVVTHAQSWGDANPKWLDSCPDCQYSSSGALVDSFSMSGHDDKALAGNPYTWTGAMADAVGSKFAVTQAFGYAETGTCDECNFAVMTGLASAEAANDRTRHQGPAAGSALAMGEASATGSNPVAWTQNYAGVTLKALDLNDGDCGRLGCKSSVSESTSFASTCEDIETPPLPECDNCDENHT